MLDLQKEALSGKVLNCDSARALDSTVLKHPRLH